MSHYGDERLADDGFEHFFQIDLAEILEVAYLMPVVCSPAIELLGVDADPVGKIDEVAAFCGERQYMGSTWANVLDGALCYPAKPLEIPYRPRRLRLWRSWGCIVKSGVREDIYPELSARDMFPSQDQTNGVGRPWHFPAS